MTEANVATLRAGYEALNRGDLSEVMALIDDDITFDAGPLSPDSDASARGRDGFKALIQSWLDAFDEFRIQPLDVIADGDKLVAAVRQSGRGRGSGVDIAVEIAHVWTVRDGQAIRLASYPNLQAALTALDIRAITALSSVRVRRRRRLARSWATASARGWDGVRSEARSRPSATSSANGRARAPLPTTAM